MPVTEMLIKDIKHGVKALSNYMANGMSRKTLVVYPHYPSSGSTIYRVGKLLKANITNKITPNTKAIIYWEYLTFREEYKVPEKLAKTHTVVNLHSRDISKKYVDDAFKKTFGYGTFINPLEHTGKAVQKSDINATHDGKVINCPVAPVEDDTVIYQVLIDNSYEGNLVKDIRVPVVKDKIPFVYYKYRDIKERFKNTAVKTELVDTVDAFTNDELQKLLAFCKNIQLEFGEMDVLRDNNNGLIYVVDVNNTPQGPPANIPKEEGKKALAILAQEFEKSYL